MTAVNPCILKGRRKFIVVAAALFSAMLGSYTMDETSLDKFYSFLETLVTFYVVGQGAVDVAGQLNEKKPTPQP